MTNAGPDVLPAATRRPQEGTPSRIPGSIRRSSHIGVRWPDDVADPMRSDLLVHGAVRDVHTDAHGEGRIIADAVLDCVVAPDRTVASIAAAPDVTHLQTLVGRIARGGWRAAARDVVGNDSALTTLLDDVPIALLLSSYGALRQGAMDMTSVQPLMLNMRNLCAGWAEDATPMRLIDAGQPMPLPGVVSVPTRDEVDPLATEPRSPIVAGEVRRTRRLDVVPGDTVLVHASFRDTWCDGSGAQGVLHEYVATATLTDELVVASIEAEPRVLPYNECTLAAASPQRLVGVHIDAVADEVRATAGIATCTHLDDLLRSLAAIPALVTSFSAGGYARAARPGADD